MGQMWPASCGKWAGGFDPATSQVGSKDNPPSPTPTPANAHRLSRFTVFSLLAFGSVLALWGKAHGSGGLLALVEGRLRGGGPSQEGRVILTRGPIPPGGPGSPGKPTGPCAQRKVKGHQSPASHLSPPPSPR